ncbi:isochorismate synthase [Listeria ilorinensis]|uniref:isochorismate synthase n=1 Tax=Listeria ilorinensis TaxID=2867439 RepID=UPI001EF4AAA3|nr:isochorismate synthase [Listeria ilorinensis]
MGITLPEALFDQAKRHASKDQPTLLSFVTTLSRDVSPKELFQKAKTHFVGERFYWQNPDKTLKMAGLGVTKQFLADQTKDAYVELAERVQRLKRDTVTNATVKETGPLYFGGFSFDPERETDKEWQSFKDGLFYLPLFMITERQDAQYLTVNFPVYIDDDYSKCEAVCKQWEKIMNSPLPKLEIDSLAAVQELEPEHFLASAREVIELIQGSKEIHKVVLSRRMGMRFTSQVDSGAILEQMLATQENSYFFVLENGSAVFFGATPERLVSLADGELHSSCVAGSAPRGESEEQDEKLGQALLKDGKNLREHHFVVEMIEATFKRFANELSLSSEPVLLKNRDIQHLYMNIHAKVHPETNLLEVVEALHPTPALGGLPQKLALAVIRMKEKNDRGFYGAPIGFIDADFEGEFAVAIRSGLIIDAMGILFAGCGIVADSVPEEELKETKIKFQPMLRVLGGMEHE